MVAAGAPPANEEGPTQPGADPGFASGPDHGKAGLADILANLFHDRLVIGASFLLVFATAVLIALNMARVYETEARLLVLPGEEYTSQPLAFGGFSAGNLVSDQISKAEIEVLSSNELRREVVRRLGAGAIYPDLGPNHAAGPGASPDDVAARRLADDLLIEPQQDSSIVRIRLRHRDPVVAARVVNELLEAYLGARLSVFNRDRAAFLVPRREEADEALAQRRAALAAFNAAHGVTSLPREIALRLEQQARLALQAMQARQAAAQATAQAAALQRSVDALPARVLLATDRTSDTESGNSRATLLSLQLRRQELLSKYAETSGYIQDIDQQIAALRSFESRTGPRTSSATNMGPNPAVDALRIELDAATGTAQGQAARADEIEQQAAEVKRRLAELLALQPEQLQLERATEMAQARSALLVRRYEEALVAESFERRRVGNVRITQLASPGRPVSSGRVLVLGAGVLLGLVVAALFAFFRALMRETMLTPGGVVQRLGLPVLVAVQDRR